MNNQNSDTRQNGLSSLTILIIVTLSVFIAWELTYYVNNYFARNSIGLGGPADGPGGPNRSNCIRTDPRDCQDQDEAADYQGN